MKQIKIVLLATLLVLLVAAASHAQGIKIIAIGPNPIPFVTPGANGNCLTSNGSQWVSAGCTGTSGVASFNGRVAVVTLGSTDIGGAGGMLATNNLSDVGSVSTARTNLGVPTGTSGAVLCFLNANCAFSGTPTFTNIAPTIISGTTTISATTTASGIFNFTGSPQINGVGFQPIATSGSAVDLSTGTLPAARLGGFTGDVSSIGGTYGLTLVTVNGSPGTYNCGGSFSITTNGKGLVTSGNTGTCAGGGGPGGPGDSIAMDGSHSLALDGLHGLRLQ